MKKPVLAATIVLSILGVSEFARADGEVQVRPIDVYISGFGGYSLPMNTDFSSSGITAADAELNNSPSFGGKIGVWFTAPRKRLGIDIGMELDATNSNPDLPGGQILQSNAGLVSPIALDLNTTYYGLQVLARIPIDATTDLPNGRWFPYIGVGGGGQRLSYQAAGTTEGKHTAPAFQGLGGVKVFLTKHIAVFTEGKYIHASHKMTFQGALGTAEADLNVNAVHGVGGLSVHF